MKYWEILERSFLTLSKNAYFCGNTIRSTQWNQIHIFCILSRQYFFARVSNIIRAISLDASEEARYHFLLKWRGSSMLQMVDGNGKWIYQPPRWLFPPRVPNIEVGAEL